MFDILIGTLIPSRSAAPMIRQLNPKGFECYELSFGKDDFQNFDTIVNDVNEALDGRKISALGFYGNPMCDKDDYDRLVFLIENAHRLNCNRVCTFAGGDREKSVPENIPLFKETFEPLAKLAEQKGIKIGFENCGEGWNKGTYNIAFAPAAWELMFEAVPSDALGLEWEPAHQVCALIDPIPLLRKWAKRVVHVHGKDGSVAWDVLKEYGIHGSHRFAEHRTPGFGDTNWADVFTILLQNGYQGCVSIEGYHDVVHYDDMEWTAQVTSLEYLKRCRGGVEYFRGPEEYRGYKKSRKGDK